MDLFIAALLGSIIGAGAIAFFETASRKARAAELKSLKQLHETKENALRSSLQEYQAIAESHTITWKGFEPEEWMVLCDKTLVAPGAQLEESLNELLLPYENEEVRATFSIGVKGEWSIYLSSTHGWGTYATGVDGIKRKTKGLTEQEVTWLSYWEDTVTEGKKKEIYAAILAALHSKHFWTAPKGDKEAFYDRPDSLHFKIKIEKKVPQEHPVPQVKFVEVKVAALQEACTLDPLQEEERKLAERAAKLASELETDPKLWAAVRTQVKT